MNHQANFVNINKATCQIDAGHYVKAFERSCPQKILLTPFRPIEDTLIKNGETVTPTLLKAQEVRSQGSHFLEAQTQELKAKGVIPALKVLLVGEDPGSVLYTNNKKIFVESFGAKCEIVRLHSTISEKAFLKALEEISQDPLVHGAFVQLPLPGSLSHLNIGEFIPASKDVDGLSPLNIYRLMTNDKNALVPCTPKGIVGLLDHYGIALEGKNVTIIGRSMIVGKPLGVLLTNRNATVTLCHSRTKNIEEITRRSDMIVTAMGKEKFLSVDHLGDNRPVVVDVGINRGRDGKVCGDVDFKAVAPLSSAITPVPGGVGPMTIYSLAQNLLQATHCSLSSHS